MKKREEIIELYFDENYNQKEIAEKLNTSPKYVSRILLTDKRYQKEKENKKARNQKKHRENTKEYIKQQRKQKQLQNNADDLIIKAMHKSASVELSSIKRLSNIAYRNWNTSAYSFNEKKKQFELKKELGRSHDVPKYIKVEV